MIGFDFLRAGAAWWALLGALALVLGVLALRRSRRELVRFVSERQLARFVPGHSPARAHLRVVLGAVALALLAAAAAGPVRGYTFRAVSRKGLDLVLCLDTSRSMLARDLRPSRLERAKREVTGLLDHLRGDRVALVAFSGDARDVAPLTRDRATLEDLLSFVTPEDNQAGGTDLAAAIERALALFDGRTGAHEAVVLLTDGEDLEGRGASLAEEAAKRGIRIYVVGFGTEAGGKIPVLENGKQSFLRDPDGQEVVTKLERKSLTALAQRTGGDFLSAEESPTPLEDLYRSRIGRIEGREIEGGERRVPYDRFQWPLALALAALLFEIALRDRAPRRAAQSGAPRLAAALLPLCLAGGDAGRFQRSLESTLKSYEAGKLAEAELTGKALLDQADALALDDRQRAEVHFALALVRAARAQDAGTAADERQEAWEGATEDFHGTRALAGPGELRLEATYGLGSVALYQAEAKRAEIPEVQAQAGGTPFPGAPVPGPASGGLPSGAPVAPPVDALPQARKLYQDARTWFVERLRADWRDVDTRADLELIQRRLRELDEIEKKREEQKKEQENQDQNQDRKDQQKPEDGDQEKKDPKDQKEQEKKDEQPKDPQDQPQEEPPKDPKDEQPDQQPQPEEQQQPAAQEEKKAAAERVLTREEVMQLLDKLAELEKQQKALDAAARAKRRAAVKRDW